MFWHIFKNRIKLLVRNRIVFFWSAVFPIILGTLFYFTFGSAMSNSENFDTIPVAVVEEENAASSSIFFNFLEEAETADGVNYFSVSNTDEADAWQLLEDGDVLGIIYVGEEISLTVKESGLSQTVLKSVLDSYQTMETAITEVAVKNPEKLAEFTMELLADTALNQEISLGGETLDTMVSYFYALIGMACMFNCFLGATNVEQIQANQTALGARRNVSPVHKMSVVLMEYLAALVNSFFNLAVLLAYLTLILKIDFGGQFGYIAIVAAAGGMMGVAFGTFVGAVVAGSEALRVGIMVSFGLISSFFSGLMFSDMKVILEKNFPIANRLIPSTLIADAFYCLNIYDDYTRYWQNVLTLIALSAFLCVVSFLVIRRKKYASL